MENHPRNGSACFSESTGSCLCASHATHLVLPILYGLMFVTGLPGNTLSLWIFIAKIRTKTSTHVYLISLGISNLLLCFSMPFQAAYSAKSGSWRADHPACRVAVSFVTPLLYVNIYVGMFTLTWIALSRCAVLVQHDYDGRPSNCTKVLPSRVLHSLRQARFAKTTCVATWVFVVTCLFPVVIYYSIKEAVATGGEGVGECYSIAVEVGGQMSQKSGIAAAAFFYACFAIVLLCYISVTRHFRRSQKSTTISSKAATYSRALRNIVIVQLVLTVCLLPFHIFRLVFYYLALRHVSYAHGGCHPMSQLVEVKNFLVWLAVLRCSTDPIMYFQLDKTFRKFAMGIFKDRVSSTASQSTGSNVPAGPISSQCTNLVQNYKRVSPCTKITQQNPEV